MSPKSLSPALSKFAFHRPRPCAHSDRLGLSVVSATSTPAQTGLTPTCAAGTNWARLSLPALTGLTLQPPERPLPHLRRDHNFSRGCAQGKWWGTRLRLKRKRAQTQNCCSARQESFFGDCRQAAHTHARTRARTRARTHARTHTHTHTHAHKSARAHTHEYMQRRAHERTPAHALTDPQAP